LFPTHFDFLILIQLINKQIFKECLIAVKEHLDLMKIGKRFEKWLHYVGFNAWFKHILKHKLHKEALKENCYWLQQILKKGISFQKWFSWKFYLCFTHTFWNSNFIKKSLKNYFTGCRKALTTRKNLKIVTLSFFFFVLFLNNLTNCKP